jgi:lipoprotein-anchoring transpeptidase ErfK/SrfK
MGRAVAILLLFATVVGVCAVWSPFRLQTESKQQASAVVEHEVPDEPESAPTVVNATAVPTTAANDATISPVRKTGASGRSAREPVLAATSPIPVSPLSALPEKAISGFPMKPRSAVSSDQVAAVVKQSKHLRAEGQVIEARDLLSDTYLANQMDSDSRNRLADELEPLASEILRSQTVLEDGRVYEVQSGDVLVKIAKPFQVPPEYLMKINNLKNARTIRSGQRLKLVQGPFDVLVDLSQFELTVLRHGKFVKRFAIGIGRTDSPTPVGLFKVGTKLSSPMYYPPPSDTEHRRPVPYGSPDNPLGSRWIDIGLGYGIHGTTDPRSIGQESSRGCIRMRNDDVEEVYDMVTEGSRVLIR